MFQQVEGLLVGEGVTMADLKGTLECFLRQLFEADTRVMFRPSFFPYTEPERRGVHRLRLLQRRLRGPASGPAGWRFSAAAWCIRPLLEAVGYDSEKLTGWAFGVGIDRIAILKYRVEDIRAFYDNDLRLLEQFPY